jgi:hypothetical protein
MPRPEAAWEVLLRDQRRALYAYLIAARETLQVATWLKRAAQARSRSA